MSGRSCGGIKPEYLHASLAMADVFGLFDIKLREWLGLDLIRKKSFGAGKLEAELTQGFFIQALRISKGNVSAMLSELKRKLAIEEVEADRYGFRMPIANWKFARRGEEVETVNQLDLFDDACLERALRSTFVGAFSQYGQVHDISLLMPGEPSPGNVDHGRRSAVPESGTDGATGKVFPIREPHEGTGKTGVPVVVPESGTEKVPESGTLMHDHDHAQTSIACSCSEHAGEFPIREPARSRLPAHLLPILRKEFEVGATGKVSGEDLFALVRQVAPRLNERNRENWLRRIGENARLVWNLAQEAKVSTAIRNAPGWMNRGYMKEMGLGKFSR